MGLSGKEAKFAAPVGRRLIILKTVINCTLTSSALCIGVWGLWVWSLAAQTGLVDEAVLTSFLAVACPFVTMLQFVAPTPLVAAAVRKMHAQSLPTSAFRTQAACNILSMAYGIQIANSAVLVTNAFGLGCQLCYLVADHFVRSSNGMWLRFSVQLAVLFNCCLVVSSLHTRIDILGNLITALNIFMYATPLGNVQAILQSRNSSTINTGITCIAVINNAMWTLYGFLIKDNVVLVPSALGYILSAFQVLVILWCHGSLPFDLSFLLMLCRDKHDIVTLKPEKKLEEGMREIPVAG